MKKRLSIFALAALGAFAPVNALWATTGAHTEMETESAAQKDYQQVLTAAEDSELEYVKIKERLFKRYTPLVEQMEQAEKGYVSVFSGTEKGGLVIKTGDMPADFRPWWQGRVNGHINKAVPEVATDITSLFSRALKYSSQIKVFSDLPLIRETTIQEAQGPFDFRIFAEGRVTDLDEPTGDDLQTGGPLRYKEHSKDLAYGVKKKFITGAEVELKQNIGDMDTNSIYFNPQDQARTGTYLTITQPLLKRFGIGYNSAAIDLAGLDHSVSQEELRRDVESHLLEVARAYWGLYLERSLLLQKTRLAEETNKVFTQMQQRTGVDVPPSLLARARSLASAHELSAMQAEYAMLNAQSRVRALVNDPELINAAGLEMVTNQLPYNKLFDVSFDQALQTTLNNRPEVAQALKHIQSAYLRLASAKNELRPDLDLFFQTYVKGLEGDFRYGRAYSDQFDEGDASFIGGLRLEYPLGNNGSKARAQRKKLEIRQLLYQLDTTVENVLLETQVSYRELVKNYRSMVQSYQIMRSDEEEVKALQARVDYLLTNKEQYGDVLYRLMDAGERLTKSEELFANSELTYNYSLYNLHRAMGILVSTNKITVAKEEARDGEDLPVIRIQKETDK